MPGNEASACQSSAGFWLVRILVAGHERDRAGELPMRNRDSRISRCGDPGRDPGHDLELDTCGQQRLGLLAATTEHERIAALEADDQPAAGPVLEQQPLDLLLRHRGAAAFLPRVDQRRVGPRARERLFWNQPVIDDHLGGGDQLQRPGRQQPGVAWTRPNQVDRHRATSASRSARSQQSPRPDGDRPLGDDRANLRRRTGRAVGDPLRAVRQADPDPQFDGVRSGERRQGADRGVAACPDSPGKCPFGEHTGL